MFNKIPLQWAFFTQDVNKNFTLVSTRICIRPAVTKNFKEVSKLFDNKIVFGAGCMLLMHFPK